MSVIRRRWHFTGNVQGVGFRYFAQCAAQKLGLTGWVANNWDGSVTLEAQGERAALDELVPMIERSNRWARIEGMTTETLPPEEHEYSFSTEDNAKPPHFGEAFCMDAGFTECP